MRCAKETRSNWCKRRFLPNVLAVEKSGISRWLLHAVSGANLGKLCWLGGKFLSEKLNFGLLHPFVDAPVAFPVVELNNAVQIAHVFRS